MARSAGSLGLLSTPPLELTKVLLNDKILIRNYFHNSLGLFHLEFDFLLHTQTHPSGNILQKALVVKKVVGLRAICDILITVISGL